MEERERVEQRLKEEKQELKRKIQRLESTVRANEEQVQYLQWNLDMTRGKS